MRRSASRMVSMAAYEAGGVAGASLAINPESATRLRPKRSGENEPLQLM
jgi:hypothetical protein